MAITTAGRTLTDQHRRSQLDISRRVIRDVLELWSLMRAENLDASLPAFQRAFYRAISLRRRESADLAAAYYVAFRRAEGAGGTFTPRPAYDIDPARVNATARITGPVAVKTGIRTGKPVEAAMRTARDMTASAGIRLVQEGGRETIRDAVREDPEAVGMAWITDGDPCFFCAMLASRGAVYTVREQAQFKPHDGCGCQLEPVFSKTDYKTREQAEEYRRLWEEATAGYSGQDAINAFRRAFNRRNS